MSFTNEKLSRADQAMGMAASLNWSYNNPLNVPQNFSAVCSKTTQNISSVTIKNLSSAFSLTVYVDPAPAAYPGGFIEIAANDPKPVRWAQNYNGAVLKLANVSQEAATGQITLTDLG